MSETGKIDPYVDLEQRTGALGREIRRLSHTANIFNKGAKARQAFRTVTDTSYARELDRLIYTPLQDVNTSPVLLINEQDQLIRVHTGLALHNGALLVDHLFSHAFKVDEAWKYWDSRMAYVTARDLVMIDHDIFQGAYTKVSENFQTPVDHQDQGTPPFIRTSTPNGDRFIDQMGSRARMEEPATSLSSQLNTLHLMYENGIGRVHPQTLAYVSRMGENDASTDVDTFPIEISRSQTAAFRQVVARFSSEKHVPPQSKLNNDFNASTGHSLVTETTASGYILANTTYVTALNLAKAAEAILTGLLLRSYTDALLPQNRVDAIESAYEIDFPWLLRSAQTLNAQAGQVNNRTRALPDHLSIP